MCVFFFALKTQEAFVSFFQHWKKKKTVLCYLLQLKDTELSDCGKDGSHPSSIIVVAAAWMEPPGFKSLQQNLIFAQGMPDLLSLQNLLLKTKSTTSLLRYRVLQQARK
jgi:hypothetical protein